MSPLFAILVMLSIAGCNQNQTVTGTGTQVWDSLNLDVSTFRNGDPIPEIKSAEEWSKAGENGQPAWCYYENDPANGAKYGKLYNWHAAKDSRGLCPTGWHVPSDEEWTVLTDYLGGEDAAGGKMKSTSGWDNDGNGNNSSAFSGLPGGYRDDRGTFIFNGSFGYWWSSTEGSTNYAWSRYLPNASDRVTGGNNHKSNGLSIRCLRD